MKRIATLFALTVLTSAAHAAPETYTIDNSHTFPYFTYSHFGFSTQSHRFDRTSGTVSIDRAGKTGTVDVVIDATSVNTGFPLFNEHIQSEDFFDTAQHPTITFKSKAMKFKGDQPVSVTGDLTLKGVTRPVTLAISQFKCMTHPVRKVDACGANASTTLKRTDFNMGKYAPGVSDEVSLVIAIETYKAAPAP